MNYLTMREFGKWGRWANQLFQYAFLRTYAEKHDCELQLPPWVGNALLGHDDPSVAVDLPPRLEQTDHLDQAEPPKGAEYINCDFRGYAQYHTSYYRQYGVAIQSLWWPTDAVRQRLRPAVDALRSAGRTRVGIHLRRGDYGRLMFYITPVNWYRVWLEANWAGLNRPVLFISTETPALVNEFADYCPVTAASLGVDLAAEPLAHYQYLGPDLSSREPFQMDFFPDWWLLAHCDVLLMPNSSFSFTAAMANPRLRALYRSDLSQQGFLKIAPWDSYPLTHDKAEDYRHVPGVCLDETPYWRRLPDGSFQEKT